MTVSDATRWAHDLQVKFPSTTTPRNHCAAACKWLTRRITKPSEIPVKPKRPPKSKVGPGIHVPPPPSPGLPAADLAAIEEAVQRRLVLQTKELQGYISTLFSAMEAKIVAKLDDQSHRLAVLEGALLHGPRGMHLYIYIPHHKCFTRLLLFVFCHACLDLVSTSISTTPYLSICHIPMCSLNFSCTAYRAAPSPEPGTSSHRYL